jgi:hypothetical protein
VPPILRRTPPAPTDASLALDILVAPLLGRTFELRRAYEKKLRLLTDLQHEIETVRNSKTPFPRRRQGLENLEHHFRDLAKATKDASDLLQKLRVQFDDIHEQSIELEKEQRKR